MKRQFGWGQFWMTVFVAVVLLVQVGYCMHVQANCDGTVVRDYMGFPACVAAGVGR
jgi:hypothetical protein